MQTTYKEPGTIISKIEYEKPEFYIQFKKQSDPSPNDCLKIVKIQTKTEEIEVYDVFDRCCYYGIILKSNLGFQAADEEVIDGEWFDVKEKDFSDHFPSFREALEYLINFNSDLKTELVGDFYFISTVVIEKVFQEPQLNKKGESKCSLV